jgi:hypothetical protein
MRLDVGRDHTMDGDDCQSAISVMDLHPLDEETIGRCVCAGHSLERSVLLPETVMDLILNDGQLF